MRGSTASTDPHCFLVARLRESAGALVAAVDGVQLYGLPRAAEVAEVERATEGVVDFIAGAVLTDRGLDAPAKRSLRRLGTRRAAQGVPLEQVNTAFRRATSAGLQVMKDAAVGWPESIAAWDAFTDLADRLFLLVQTATDSVRDGYEEWMHGREVVGAHEHAVIVEDIFEGSWATADEMIDCAKAFGYPLTKRCLVLSVLPLGGCQANDLHDAILGLAGPVGVPRLAAGRLRGTPVHHVPCIIPLPRDGPIEVVQRRVDVWARAAGAVAVTAPVEDIVLVPATYKRMREELDLGVAAIRTPGAVDWVRGLHVARLLQTVRHENVEAFVRPTLGSLLAQPASTAERLLETLSALFSWDGSVKRLATSLSLSHSGLRTRLLRVEELTDRHHSRDRVELVLALLLFRIHRVKLPPMGDARWAA